MFIYPYKAASKSVALLAEALDAKIIRLENSKFKGSENKLIINWGNSMTNEEIEKATVLNHPKAVAQASNKLTFFELAKGQIPIPEFTTDVAVAREWLPSSAIVVRETLTGHSGEGIFICETNEEFDNYLDEIGRAKMFTRYIPKKDEFRIHVVNGEIIDVQQKKRNRDRNTPNWKIRNHSNGFIYAREGVELPSDEMALDAIKAVELCGLYFGAVDMIWNAYKKQGYVLEINTAPGLEGQTVENYAEHFAKSTKRKLRDIPEGLRRPVDMYFVAPLENEENQPIF